MSTVPAGPIRAELRYGRQRTLPRGWPLDFGGDDRLGADGASYPPALIGCRRSPALALRILAWTTAPVTWKTAPVTREPRVFPMVDTRAVPWLSVEQMREVARIMVEELGISLVRMMENAGRDLAQVARELLGGDTAGRAIVVLAGPGGNGGGGLVAARHLAVAGAEVAVVVSAPAERFTPVPAEQLTIAQRLAIPIHEQIESLGEPDLVIDALLGYNQRGGPRGRAAELIRWSAGRRVLALDVPSGLELASGTLHAPHVTAEATMTLAAPKTALAVADASAAVGEGGHPALVPYTDRPTHHLVFWGSTDRSDPEEWSHKTRTVPGTVRPTG
jgi:NAD(P)H-hydrate epimerase